MRGESKAASDSSAPFCAMGVGSGTGVDVAAQFAAKTLTELLDGEIALNAPAEREADGSGFFGADDSDSVGFFGDADAGAMASAELRGQQRIHGKRKEAGSGGDAIFLHDDGSVMERGAGTKNRCEQVVGQAGIERNSALDVGAKTDFAFDHDQSSGLMLGKKIGGKDDVIVGIALRRRSAEEGQAAARDRRARGESPTGRRRSGRKPHKAKRG